MTTRCRKQSERFKTDKESKLENGEPRTTFISLLNRRVQFSMDNVCKPFAGWHTGKIQGRQVRVDLAAAFLARKHAECVCVDTLGLGTCETDVIHWATAIIVNVFLQQENLLQKYVQAPLHKCFWCCLLNNAFQTTETTHAFQLFCLNKTKQSWKENHRLPKSCLFQLT